MSLRNELAPETATRGMTMNEQKTMTGGCVCGAVTWEIDGEPAKFLHCHCSRCRRTTGTGHATNLIVPITSEIRWTGSKDDRGSFKLPDAERYATHFCKTCGSPLPRGNASLGFAVVPAGTVSSELTILPQGRIFGNSRAEWSCDDTEIPCFDEYPPQ